MTNYNSGPNSFAGPIGKLLEENIYEWEVGAFEVIPAMDFPRLNHDVYKELSNDAQILYDLCLALVDGEFIFKNQKIFGIVPKTCIVS